MCLWDPNLIPPLQLAIWHSQNPSKSQGPSSFSPIFDGHNMIDCKNALRPSRGYLPGVIPHPWPFCSQHRPAEGRSPRASNCGNGSLGWLDMVEGPVAMFFYWSSGVKRNEKNTFPLFRKTHQTDESSPVTARRKNCKTTIWETKKHATNRRESLPLVLKMAVKVIFLPGWVVATRTSITSWGFTYTTQSLCFVLKDLSISKGLYIGAGCKNSRNLAAFDEF